MKLELQFPRYIFAKGGQKTKLVGSPEEFEAAMDMGWFENVLDAKKAAEPAPLPVSLPPKSVSAFEAFAEETEAEIYALPTRAELEAKAFELGIKFDKRLGDKKLAAAIEKALGFPSEV
jgi:hypothetical protein